MSEFFLAFFSKSHHKSQLTHFLAKNGSFLIIGHYFWFYYFQDLKYIYYIFAGFYNINSFPSVAFSKFLPLEGVW